MIHNFKSFLSLFNLNMTGNFFLSKPHILAWNVHDQNILKTRPFINFSFLKSILFCIFEEHLVTKGIKKFLVHSVGGICVFNEVEVRNQLHILPVYEILNKKITILQ